MFFPVVNDRLTAVCAPAERFCPDLNGVSTKGPTSENRRTLCRDFDVTLSVAYHDLGSRTLT